MSGTFRQPRRSPARDEPASGANGRGSTIALFDEHSLNAEFRGNESGRNISKISASIAG